ncbi:MAG: hypothetical protein DCF19_11150 [Pseudanabaena frigida]|uniref:GAF domain-containing protein n=1 Tax=Pseudanabaena frigida TaxID=945775 RepID=A0A2W4YCI0_9CYAN|nr:MAG: hypothetical protein DCF19_11150 [Pseudanabaena frigida]
MDSTLLDQIRHLCRDRSSYEHLKAILVQQERVHQLSWEERYTKLIAAQESSGATQASDIFSNIIAREKALAQLADAIQRSPSIELVLQIAVQVAQKLLQVDRVAIFRRLPDGRGEFETDAIAAGLESLADMPERQLSLTRHIIESTQPESSVQTVDNISSSGLSSHIVTLLEQIGISSYATNKIYAGQEIWGNLVAFHGSAYHVWTESDRTSLSLIAAQIGIAISLTNLRQQSQDLTNDLQTLQIELANLQKTVLEIANSQPQSPIPLGIPTAEEQAIAPTPLDLFEEDSKEDLANAISENDSAEVETNIDRVNPNSDGESLTIKEQIEEEPQAAAQEIANDTEEILDDEITSSEYPPIPQNGVPPLFLIPDPHTSWSTLENELKNEDGNLREDIITDRELKSIEEFTKTEPPQFPLNKNDLATNDSDSSEVTTPELSDAETTDSESKLEIIEPELVELEISVSEEAESESTESEIVDVQLVQPQISDIEQNQPEISELEQSAEIELDRSEESNSEIDTLESSEPEESEVSAIASEKINQNVTESEPIESELEQIDASQTNLEMPVLEIDNDDDRDPAIEPQFIETILSIAGHDIKGINFLLEVIDSYLEETPRIVHAIDKAIATNDRPKILNSINKLRASSDYVGALALSYQCRQLESAVKANYVVLIYACLSQVAIEAQRATDALRIERSRYKFIE